jgi:hypothetical protein
MTLKIFELINIFLSAIVGGMYWGPWLALSRSLKEFEPKIFLSVVGRLNQNMATLMTILTPLSLFSTLPVLFISYKNHITTFYLTSIGFIFYVIALVVTVVIEVPIVKQIVTWTVITLPDNWELLRDRWGKFHIVRIVAGILGLIFLIAGALFD